MKSIFLSILFTTLLLSILSCEENFSPYGNGEEIYILNCVLNPDTSFQTATLSHSYHYEDINPYNYITDPAVSGANIRISYEDEAAIFTEGRTVRADASRYGDSAVYYYVNDFSIVPGKEYIIDVHLPNGKRLRSKTKTPDEIEFNLFKCDTLIPPANKDWVGVYWNTPYQDLYAASVFKVYYFKNENGVKVRHEKRVPVKYIKKGDEYAPHFPEPSYAGMIYVEMDAFTRALLEISEGDPNKENYIILAFILEVRIYDENLTSYWASTTEVAESFTLKLDESDFTNIEGGLGIFGSYIKQRKSVKFSHAYIESFGYIPGLTE